MDLYPHLRISVLRHFHISSRSRQFLRVFEIWHRVSFDKYCKMAYWINHIIFSHLAQYQDNICTSSFAM